MEVGLATAAASATAAAAGAGTEIGAAERGAAAAAAAGSLENEVPFGEAADGVPGVMLPPAAARAWRDSSVTG